MKEPSSPNEAREWLRGVADYLSSVPNASNRLKFTAHAIKKYLSGKCSLEAALALKKKPGAPKRPHARLKQAREIFKMRLAGKTWDDISATVDPTGNTETSSLRRTYKEFRITLMSDKIWEELAPALNKLDADSPRNTTPRTK